MKPFVIVAPNLLARLSIVIGIGAMTVWPCILTRDAMSETTLRHETIHLRQQRECLALGSGCALALGIFFGPLTGMLALAGAYALFFILYGLFWAFNRIHMSGPEAYEAIRFEREAYDNQDDESYLDNRPLLAWLRR